MSVQLAMIKDEIMVAMEDAANPEYDHWFVTVAELKKVLDVRPEDVGKVWLAVRVKYSLPEVDLKDALEETDKKTDEKTDKKPEKETHCYHVTIKQFRQSEGFVLSDCIEDARFIANQAAQKGLVTWTLPETRSTAKRVNPDNSFQRSAAFFNALEIPSSYIALKSLYDQMKGENG